MNMASVITIGAGLGLAIPLWQLRKRSQQLDGLPGPASPSFLTGHTVDLRQAPTSTRWNVWQKEHGATYRLNGPLMVCLHLYLRYTYLPNHSILSLFWAILVEQLMS
jgi:hypothetical protein